MGAQEVAAVFVYKYVPIESNISITYIIYMHTNTDSTILRLCHPCYM